MEKSGTAMAREMPSSLQPVRSGRWTGWHCFVKSCVSRRYRCPYIALVASQLTPCDQNTADRGKVFCMTGTYMRWIWSKYIWFISHCKSGCIVSVSENKMILFWDKTLHGVIMKWCRICERVCYIYIYIYKISWDVEISLAMKLSERR